MTARIRWMIRADLPRVLEIEREGFRDPWTEQDFMGVLAERSTIAMVIEVDDIVEGFMVYALRRDVLYILNVSVSPDKRLQGLGSLMVAKLQSKLGTRRSTLMADVSEANLSAQLFFRSLGLSCVAILPEFFEAAGLDAYRFSYVVVPEDAVA